VEVMTATNLDHIAIYNQPDCILPKSFFEGRFVPNFHPETIDYEQWWKEQIRRSREGWSDGGHSVTGPFYYHLNFKKINMLNHLHEECIEHPYFSYEDQQLFEDVEIAKKAGKGVILITGRGFGKSFDATTIAEHRFVMYPATEVIVSASTAFFVDSLWGKIDVGLNSLPDALRPTLIVDKSTQKESGIEIFENGKKVTIGYRSKLWKVVYDNDEGRTRGTRPAVHIFEEIGSWSGKAKLIACYKATMPSWRRGSFFTCMPILIGTGGQMKTGASQDAEKMFWDPEPYGLMSFKYPGQPWWNGKPCGKFYTCFDKWEGFYEKTGYTDKEAAKEWHDKHRESLKGNLDMYLQWTMEFPYNPYEAFRVDGSGIFDNVKLEARHLEIKKSEVLSNMVQRGRLEFINRNNPLAGVKFIQDKNGCIEILEHPEWVANPNLYGDEKIPHLYVSGCDSYDTVGDEEASNNTSAEDSKSKGSIFMFKRFWKTSITGRLFVAKCTIRERNSSNFYWETVKMNLYYNSQMLYEHTKVGIGQHYITHKISHLLYERPKLEEVTVSRQKVVNKTQVTNRFGLVMPIQIKIHCIKRYAEYTDQYTSSMYFLTQIEDALKFNFLSNKHDETMAASLCIVADEDMYDIEIKERKKKVVKFPTFGTVNGRTSFG
jgi:hypothetical protein